MNAFGLVKDRIRRLVGLLVGGTGLLLLGLPLSAVGVVEGAACSGAEPYSVTYGNPLLCSIEAVGDSDTFKFTGAAGTTTHIQVTHRSGGYPSFTVYRPDGTVAGSAYSVYQAPALDLSVDQTGTWSILVAVTYNNAVMEYTLSLERVVPPSANATAMKSGDLLADEINPIGDIDLFYFNVCGVSTWNVQITRTGLGSPQFCLYRPDGTLVSCPYNAAAASATYTIEQPGIHAILVGEWGSNSTLPYNATLSCVAGDCRDICSTAAPNCFESGTGAAYMKACVNTDGTLSEFQSPSGYQQLSVLADNKEGYALCSGTGTVHGYDAGVDGAGFRVPTVNQPGGPGTLPLTIVRKTIDGKFELTQAFGVDTAEKDLTVTMTVKNLTTAAIANVKLARYYNGDIDNTDLDDVYDRTLDSVWGTQGPTGHALQLYAKAIGTAHATRIEYATRWDPQGGATAAKCDVTGIEPAVPDDYVGRIGYTLGTIAGGASKSVSFVYRRQ